MDYLHKHEVRSSSAPSFASDRCQYVPGFFEGRLLQERENTYDALVLGSSLRDTVDGGGAAAATSLAGGGRLRLLRLARGHWR